MTDTQLIKYIVDKKRAPLSFDDYTNFLVLILPPMFSAIGISMIYAYYKFGDSIWLIIIGLTLIPLGLYFLYVSVVRVIQNFTFTVLSNLSNLDINQIASIINDNFRIVACQVDEKLNRLRLVTKMTAFSWGEKITIILNGTEILVNSRPRWPRQPFTIVKDANNIKKIRKLLETKCS